MRVPFARQIVLGYLLIVVLVAAGVASLLRYVDVIERAQSDEPAQRLAAERACDQLEAGLNRSLASLRGLMLSRQDDAAAEGYVQARADAWARIDHAASQLRLLAPRSADDVVLAGVADLLPAIDEMRHVQHDVERILRSGKDVPAAELLLTNVLPRGEKMLTLLTTLTDHQPATHDTTESARISELLNRLKANHVISLAALQRFVAEGAPELEAQHDLHRRTFDATLKQTEAIATAFSDEQREAWRTFTALDQAYAPLAAQVIELRSRPDWNLALHLQNKIITPLHERIELAAAEVAQRHAEQAPRPTAQLHAAAANLERGMLALLFAVAGLAILLGAWQSHRVRTGVSALLERLRAVRPDIAEHIAPAIALRHDLSQLVGLLGAHHHDDDLPMTATAASPRIDMETTAIADSASTGLADMERIAEHHLQVRKLNDTLAIITEQTHLIADYLDSEAQRLGDDGASLRVLGEELDKLSALLRSAHGQIDTDLEQAHATGHSVTERLRAIATMAADIRGKVSDTAVQIVVVDKVADKVKPPRTQPRRDTKATSEKTAAA